MANPNENPWEGSGNYNEELNPPCRSPKHLKSARPYTVANDGRVVYYETNPSCRIWDDFPYCVH